MHKVLNKRHTVVPRLSAISTVLSELASSTSITSSTLPFDISDKVFAIVSATLLVCTRELQLCPVPNDCQHPEVTHNCYYGPFPTSLAIDALKMLSPHSH